jgi:predicted RNA-binding Zn ribbon-like protein
VERPSPETARRRLLDLVESLKAEKCRFNADVAQALIPAAGAAAAPTQTPTSPAGIHAWMGLAPDESPLVVRGRSSRTGLARAVPEGARDKDRALTGVALESGDVGGQPDLSRDRPTPVSRARGSGATKRPAREAVRFGGVRTPDGYLFELTGGCLCLDLANTVDERRTPSPRELLTSYRDLLDWGRQAGALSHRDAGRLAARAEKRRAEAARALLFARSVREAIFAVFSAIAHRARPSSRGLAGLNRALARVLPERRLVSRAGGFEWAWRASIALERVVWPALASAAELLASADVSRVRECAGEGCGWLFLDRSKSRTRRWCDMTVCGNRAKVRRHRSRRN